MSIANLFVSNSYDLFCRSLTATNSVTVNGDVAKVTQYLTLYNTANLSEIVASNIPLYYVVRNGIATVWMNTSSVYTFNPTVLCTSLKMAVPATGYVTLPCPDVPDEKISVTIQALSNNNSWFKTGYIALDCTAGPSAGQGSMTFSFNPAYNTVGGPLVYTETKVAGSDSIGQTFGFLGWSYSYPVEGLV